MKLQPENLLSEIQETSISGSNVDRSEEDTKAAGKHEPLQGRETPRFESLEIWGSLRLTGKVQVPKEGLPNSLPAFIAIFCLPQLDRLALYLSITLGEHSSE